MVEGKVRLHALIRRGYIRLFIRLPTRRDRCPISVPQIFLIEASSYFVCIVGKRRNVRDSGLVVALAVFSTAL